MKRDSIVLGQNYILSGDDIGTERPNANALIVGTTGCGKSTSVMLPTLARSKNSNPILSYAKEADAYKMAEYLTQKGYTTHILNINHPLKGTVSFDPITSVESYEDINALSTSIINATIKRTVDDYWQAKACPLLNALITAGMMTADKGKKPSMAEILDLFDNLIPIEQSSSVHTKLDHMFSKLEKASPGCYATREFNSWHSLPYKTASCIRDTLACALSTNFPESVRELMQDKPQLNITKFAENKEALIIITNAVDKSQQYYVNLFYRDLIRQLLRHSTTQLNGELPREIRFFFDDFACTCPINGFGQDISLFRSAGLSAVMLLQSEAQLDAIYKDDAPIIRQNCSVYVYFPGGFDDKSCEIVSKRMGIPYEDVLYASIGKVFIMQSGRKPVYIQRYDVLNSKEYADYKKTTKPIIKSSNKSANKPTTKITTKSTNKANDKFINQQN